MPPCDRAFTVACRLPEDGACCRFSAPRQCSNREPRIPRTQTSVQSSSWCDHLAAGTPARHSSMLRNGRPQPSSTEGSDRCGSDQIQVLSGPLATIGTSFTSPSGLVVCSRRRVTSIPVVVRIADDGAQRVHRPDRQFEHARPPRQPAPGAAIADERRARCPLGRSGCWPSRTPSGSLEALDRELLVRRDIEQSARGLAGASGAD